MKNRVWALVQVGKYVGIEEMLAQVKPEERDDLKRYLRRFFLNTHGASQAQEMEEWKCMQEGAELGYKVLTALRDGLY